MFFGGFRPLTNANTNLKEKKAHHWLDINIYKIKKYHPQPSARFGHLDGVARLPELGKYKSPQIVDQRWQPRITDAPPRKPSSQAKHHELAGITPIIDCIMTRRYKKTYSNVKVCSMQYLIAWGVWSVASARRLLVARTEPVTHLRGTSRNSNDHNLEPKSLFTAIVDFRMLFIYIISIIHLPTLNIIFVIAWRAHGI